MSYSSEVLADSPVLYYRLGDVGAAVSATSASTTFTGSPASNVVDGNSTTSWTSNATSTGWVQIQYASAFVATRYVLAGRRDATVNRSPKDWQFQGSNNGSTWTTLDTRTGVTDWASQTDLRTYSFTNSTAYAYYRLNVTANNGDTYLNVTEFNAVAAFDDSTSGKAGFYFNGPTLGATGALSGDTDKAVTFASASSQSVLTSFWSGLNLTALTLECWVKTTGANQAIAGRTGGAPAPYSLFVDASGKAQWVVKTNSAGTTGTNYSGTVTINDGNWHHVVVTRTSNAAGGDLKIYVDGALDSTFTGSDAPYSIGSTGFGVASRAATPYLNGTVDEVALYNTDLSATRIAAHYAAGTGAGATTIAGGQSTTTNVGLAGTVKAGALVAGGLSVAANVALAGAVIAGSVVVGGQATEVDSARAGSVASGQIAAGGQALETDTARAGSLVAGSVVAGGQAVETDAGLAGTVIVPTAGDIVIGGVAVEYDAARPGSVRGGAYATVTRNRYGGLNITGTLPLDFTPAVAPVPASFAGKRIIAATSFNNVDVTGTVATYDTDTATKDRKRTRIIIGGKDVTHINGAQTTWEYQLVSPLLYGPGSVRLPGIKTPFRRIGHGTLKWCKEFSTVKVQLLNADDTVDTTLYRGFLNTYSIDGTDVVFQMGGEASGRAAMRNQPLPVYATRRTVGRVAHDLISGMGLPFRPFLGPANPDTTLEKVGGMWVIDAIEYVCRMSQRRDGTRFSVMPDASGDYRFNPVDTTTIDATVYVDGTRVRANVRRDMATEFNRVFATAVTPAGQRLSGISAPGIVQGTPPSFPGNLSEGDTGPGVAVLINRLGILAVLDRVDSTDGFNSDVTDAVEEIQELAGLPVTGVVNAATWDALFNLSATGFSLRGATRLPAAAQNRTERWLRTADGSIIAKNPGFDPQWPKVDVELDMGGGVGARERRSWARAELHAANTETWAGTLEVTTGAVIQGEHNPGDPLGPADLMDFRKLKPGMNIWCPGFQSDTGTLFHISGVDSDGKTLLVDTKARDTLHVWDVIQRQRAETRWRRGRRASGEVKDSVGEWDGAAGGLLYQDVDLAPGWNVVPVVAGQEGTVSRIKLTTSPAAEYYVAIFGDKITADSLDRRMGDPSTNDGHANWDDRDKRAWLRDRRLLVKWGENPAGKDENPCGYDPKSKSDGGELTGEFRDDAGFAYRTEKFPVLYMAVWADRATTLPAGRIMWNQLEPGA